MHLDIYGFPYDSSKLTQRPQKCQARVKSGCITCSAPQSCPIYPINRFSHDANTIIDCDLGNAAAVFNDVSSLFCAHGESRSLDVTPHMHSLALRPCCRILCSRALSSSAYSYPFPIYTSTSRLSQQLDWPVAYKVLIPTDCENDARPHSRRHIQTLHADIVFQSKSPVIQYLPSQVLQSIASEVCSHEQANIANVNGTHGPVKAL